MIARSSSYKERVDASHCSADAAKCPRVHQKLLLGASSEVRPACPADEHSMKATMVLFLPCSCRPPSLTRFAYSSFRRSGKLDSLSDPRRVTKQTHFTLRPATCCSWRGCCRASAILLLLLLMLVTWTSAVLIRDVYPELATWSDKLCPHSDMWVDSKGRERLLKHYPVLDNSLFRAAEAIAYMYRDTFGPGPVQLDTNLLVLVATHHKTGTVLARKIFNSMCLRMRQCCVVHVTAATEADVRKSAADKDVRLVSHSQVGN